MILNMDKIQFESRHGKKDETVQELINKLDAMSMNW